MEMTKHKLDAAIELPFEEKGLRKPRSIGRDRERTLVPVSQPPVHGTSLASSHDPAAQLQAFWKPGLSFAIPVNAKSEFPPQRN
jgi:hypothetical protein